jgi:hypothetical protein
MYDHAPSAANTKKIIYSTACEARLGLSDVDSVRTPASVAFIPHCMAYKYSDSVRVDGSMSGA